MAGGCRHGGEKALISPGLNTHLAQDLPDTLYILHGPKLCNARNAMQEAPSTAERFKDKYAQNKNTPIKGVRMGAGDRSYLVRDDQIEVLKNVYGGVGLSFLPKVLQRYCL